MSALYSLRPELEFSSQTHQGRSFVVVKDPVTNRYLRFTEGQAAILELLHSPIDVDSLASAAADRLHTPVKRESLEGFLRSLDEKLLLENAETRDKLDHRDESTKQEKNLLYLRLFSLNPDRVFDWLLPRVRWCFTPAFHVFAALAILTGFAITFSNAGRLTGHVLSLLSLNGLITIWLVVSVVVTMHEFAHGLTCCHFGGKVKELGFMLIYFQPAFYCDVSDAWMFPTRRQRIWVTLAGGYFQLVVWGIATVVWRIVAEETVISQVALIVILFAGLQTLFNFNPLIKLDGYYMLSDYLEIPNLRAKAMKAVHAWLGARSEPLLASDQRRSLLVYGGLSLTFSTLLLLFVYVNIYLLATFYFDFAGLVGFVMFSTFTLKRTAAESVTAARSLGARALIRKYRNLGIGAVFLIAIIVIPWELRISADFRILPRQESIVRAETAGTVDEILVTEGDDVAAGDLIARLYDPDKEKELSFVEGELARSLSGIGSLEARINNLRAIPGL